MDVAPTECSRPIKLRRTAVDTRTGELTESDITKDCGTRLAGLCPHCAEVYRRDAFRVIRSGLFDNGKQVPFTFLTLTAPGAETFGRIHQRVEVERKNKAPYIQRCGCGAYHDEDYKYLGTPIDIDAYDYARVADFNASASRLLAVTMQKLGRVLGRKLQYIRVAEFQARGLIHFHIIVKGLISHEAFYSVVRGGVNPRTKRRIKPAQHGVHRWGEQCDAQRILPGSKQGVGAYFVKVVNYAAKSTGDTVGECTVHGVKMDEAALATVSCDHGPDCKCGSPFIPGTTLRYQSKKSERLCRRHALARRGWGFRGHILSASRKWGMTFTAVRALRQGWATKNKKPTPHLIVSWQVIAQRSLAPPPLSV